jgi:OHCU decarboxylase
LRVHAIATERGRADAVTRRINTRLDDNARRELLSCCGSTEWVKRMMESRPLDDALAKADEIWSSLDRTAWLEAFAAHARIGEKKNDRFSAGEQSVAASADDDTKRALAEVNQQYEERFGHIYIVCATGKSADEMLALAKQRLSNAADEEIRIAAEEQRKITRLRLLKLVS